MASWKLSGNKILLRIGRSARSVLLPSIFISCSALVKLSRVRWMNDVSDSVIFTIVPLNGRAFRTSLTSSTAPI